MVHAKIHHLPSPAGVALSTVIPGGKAKMLKSPDPGCPAQPGLDGRWTSNLVLALASFKRSYPASLGTGNRSLKACAYCPRPCRRADGVRATATGSL